MHTDPHGRITSVTWIRIKVMSLIRNRIRTRNNLQITIRNVCNLRLFEHFFKRFEPSLGS
jgi:hypothetical protein